jgi:hypothetical protein
VTPPDRLYCVPGAEECFDNPGDAYENGIEPYLPDEREVIEEWSVHSPSHHLPSADRVAEYVYEFASDVEMDENCDEDYQRASLDPDVVAAFQAALDLLASKVTYRMADQLVATHLVTWDEKGRPLLDGEPMWAELDEGGPTP